MEILPYVNIYCIYTVYKNVNVYIWLKQALLRQHMFSQLQTNKRWENDFNSTLGTVRDASCSYWYVHVCRLDGNVYITYFTEIKCWACRAVMREMKSSRLLLMHEAVRNHCWMPLRGMVVLTKCHSPSTLSLVPLSPGAHVLLLWTAECWWGWRAILNIYIAVRYIFKKSMLCWGHTGGLPCSGSPMVWRWQRGHKQSSSWPCEDKYMI